MAKILIAFIMYVMPAVDGTIGASGKIVTNSVDGFVPAGADSLGRVSAAFELTDLVKAREAGEKPFLKFLDEPTIRMFVYQLPKGGIDTQTPHQFDEVYYVTGGKASLLVEDKEYQVKEGSIVYVKANARHEFHHIIEDLTVLVFFSIRSDGP